MDGDAGAAGPPAAPRGPPGAKTARPRGSTEAENVRTAWLWVRVATLSALGWLLLIVAGVLAVLAVGLMFPARKAWEAYSRVARAILGALGAPERGFQPPRR